MYKVKMKQTKRRIITLVMAVAMVLSVALPAMPVSAAPGLLGPVPVNGRILTPDRTGDHTNWVEIAQYGDYSLILRANYITIGQGDTYSGSDAFKNYMQSTARSNINKWFSGIPTSQYWDVLPIGARLRSFTVQNNATFVPGTSVHPQSLFDGISLPTIFQIGFGNDIAFALSYSEAANFVSSFYFQRNSAITNQPSNFFAIANSYKIRIPERDSYGNYHFMWLRSTGDIANLTGCLVNDGMGSLRAHQIDMRSIKGFVYPALWVNADIFETTPTSFNVTYYPNGGTGTSNSYPVAANTNHLVQDQGYTRASYTFAGWNTEANGTGTTYQNFEVVNVTRNISLYAQWRRGSSIVYHANGGVGDDYVDFGSNGSFTIRNNMFTRPQHNFGGWNTSPDGRGAILPAGLTFSGFVGELHLYAIWNRVE